MLPDRVSNPGPLTYESGALPIALRGPASGEEVDLNVFSIGGHLAFSITLAFTGLKPCTLLMLHVKFEIHGCSGFKEKVTDGPTDEQPDAYVAPC